MRKKEAKYVCGLSFFLEMHLESETPLQLLNVKFCSIECNGFTFNFFFSDF